VWERDANLAVEGELALRLSKDLAGSPSTEEDCLDAISAVFPVIELHHYVLHQARSPGPELIAGSGMHAGFVLAEELLAAPRRSRREGKRRAELDRLAAPPQPDQPQ
jgi:2-keto-4-pentenoate hydratase